MIRKKFFLSLITCSLISSTTQTGILSDVNSWISDSMPSFSFSSPSTRYAALTAIVIGSIGWIRLISKRNEKLRTQYEWTDLLKVWNITDEHYWKTVDALVVGEQFKLVEITREEIDENGNKIKIKDKRVKNTPKGLIGLFDAYVLIQLKAILENLGNIGKVCTMANTFIETGTIK